MTGTFRFADGNTGDTFNSASLYGTAAVPTVAAGTTFTIAYSISGQNAQLDGLTFNFVPEPTVIGATLGLAGVLLRRRRV